MSKGDDSGPDSVKSEEKDDDEEQPTTRMFSLQTSFQTNILLDI